MKHEEKVATPSGDEAAAPSTGEGASQAVVPPSVMEDIPTEAPPTDGLMGQIMDEKPPVTESQEIEAPKEEEMPSFDEWKQKMLAEQAKKEKTKQLEGNIFFLSVLYHVCPLKGPVSGRKVNGSVENG